MAIWMRSGFHEEPWEGATQGCIGRTLLSSDVMHRVKSRRMGSGEKTIRPVKSLEETASALEAAVLECLDKPRTKAVHKVRTTTRRIEAQLSLLPLVGGFPPYEDEAARFAKLLKKLRRAAGVVRDLDVQQDLVATESKGLSKDAKGEAGKLLRSLKGRRDAEADGLQELLQDLRRKLPRRVRGLLDALEPAEDLAVPETRLIALVRGWYREQTESFADAGSDDPERLHGVRKVAKLARYLAETAPESATRARALAHRFEAIQESGGQWHDWMILSEVAAGELGDSAALPQRFSVHAAEALDEFRKKLRYKM